MALGSQKTGLGVIVLALAGAAQAAAADFPARHRHWLGGCAGILTLDADGAAFRQVRAREGRRPHAWRWTWDDIQRLELGDDRRVRLRTYIDRRLRLGRDEAHEFVLDGTPDLVPVYELMRTAADARLAARLAAPGGRLEWELPARRLRGTGGARGVLRFYDDRIVFAADKPGDSRTWRDADIALVSSSGPLHLSLASETGEVFEFQLRRSLRPEQYERLWLRLEARRGLKLLNEEEKETAK